MSHEKSPDKRERTLPETVSSAAVEFGRVFIKNLEIEFSNASAGLRPDADWPEFRQTMMRAFVAMLRESGASADEVMLLLQSECSSGEVETSWTEDLNGRRLELIDKLIQKTLSVSEAAELERLTRLLRSHFDQEMFVPLEGARRLHARLLGLSDPKSDDL